MLTTVKASHAGSFAFAFGKGQLGQNNHLVTVIDDGAIARFAVDGRGYADLVLDGDAVVVSIAIVDDDRERAKEAGYRDDAHRRGWMHIRLGRSARDWVDAAVSTFAAHAVAART